MIIETEQQKIEFRLATPEDALDVVNFRNSYYGRTRTPGHWLWEYDTLEPKKSVFVFATDRGQIIATQGIIPIPLQIGTSSVLTGKTEDTLCLPPYRGSGIMAKLYEYAVESCMGRGIEFIWGFTNAVKAYQRFGFTCYPDIQVLVRPGSIWADIVSGRQRESSLWHQIRSVGKLILRSSLTRKGNTNHQMQTQSGYNIKKGRICDKWLDDLYQRIESGHSDIIFTRHDQKYLEWRVREHPFLSYEEYQVYQGDKLRAYAFVVLSQGTASISDILSEDEDATSLLLHAILRDYAKSAGRFRFLGNPRGSLAPNIFDQLHRFGFSIDERTSKSWTFVLRDLTGGKNRQIFDIHNWYITALWTEGFLY
jgi:GNAT superfamily N-acetyltransferase